MPCFAATWHLVFKLMPLQHMRMIPAVMFAGLQAYENLLYTTGVLYNLMVTYAFAQACVLVLMLFSIIQRW